MSAAARAGRPVAALSTAKVAGHYVGTAGSGVGAAGGSRLMQPVAPKVSANSDPFRRKLSMGFSSRDGVPLWRGGGAVARRLSAPQQALDDQKKERGEEHS